MTDTSVVTVLDVNGPVTDLRVRTTSAGGLDDYSTTRSFALTVLADARRRARDYGTSVPGAPAGLEVEQRAWPADWYRSKEFMQQSVGRYVVKTECLARRNVFGDTPGSALDGVHALVKVMGLSYADQEPLWVEASHTLDLRVHMTDARWLAGITPGLIIPTTAFDPWFDDPLRPEPPKGSPAPPALERWRVYQMAQEYWAVRLHGSELTVQHGELGTRGPSETKELGSPDAALRALKELIREKCGEGYALVNEDFGEADDLAD